MPSPSPAFVYRQSTKPMLYFASSEKKNCLQLVCLLLCKLCEKWQNVVWTRIKRIIGSQIAPAKNIFFKFELLLIKAVKFENVLKKLPHRTTYIGCTLLFEYLFSFFSLDKHSTNFTLDDKSIDGVLGTKTCGGQDSRRRQIHWAMVTLPVVDFLQQNSLL